MNTHLKTLLTLAVLTVLVLVSLTWGWSALTRPFPHTTTQKACYPTTFQAGQPDRASPGAGQRLQRQQTAWGWPSAR